MAGNTLRVDLEQARMDAQQLKNLAQDCREVYSQAKSLQGMAQEAWKGDSGTQMQSVLTGWMTKQSATAEQLENTANAILQYVASVEEADRRMAQAISGSGAGASSAGNITIIDKPQSSTLQTTQTANAVPKPSSSQNKKKDDAFDTIKDVVDDVGDVVEDVVEGVSKFFKKFF